MCCTCVEICPSLIRRSTFASDQANVDVAKMNAKSVASMQACGIAVHDAFELAVDRPGSCYAICYAICYVMCLRTRVVLLARYVKPDAVLRYDAAQSAPRGMRSESTDAACVCAVQDASPMDFTSHAPAPCPPTLLASAVRG